MNPYNHRLALKSILMITYGLALVALYSLIQLEYFSSTLKHESTKGYWAAYLSSLWDYFRVVFSGPILLVTGVVLLLKYKNYIHKLFGCISLTGGLYWAIKLYDALASF